MLKTYIIGSIISLSIAAEGLHNHQVTSFTLYENSLSLSLQFYTAFCSIAAGIGFALHRLKKKSYLPSMSIYMACAFLITFSTEAFTFYINIAIFAPAFILGYIVTKRKPLNEASPSDN